MQDSVIYRDIIAEGLQEGIQRGEANIVLRQLYRQVGKLSTELETQIKALSPQELETLADALLDFAKLEDLLQWLERN
ncbi:MAG: DUF4351 domain-containing protein, partial [Cyanobacteria bacterium J06626_18]